MEFEFLGNELDEKTKSLIQKMENELKSKDKEIESKDKKNWWFKKWIRLFKKTIA